MFDLRHSLCESFHVVWPLQSRGPAVGAVIVSVGPKYRDSLFLKTPELLDKKYQSPGAHMTRVTEVPRQQHEVNSFRYRSVKHTTRCSVRRFLQGFAQTGRHLAKRRQWPVKLKI
jgi:hypothetical protein